MTDPVAAIRRRFAPLAIEAEGALQRREEQYPALVEAGKIAAEVADREIRTWRAIAADWRAVVDGGDPVAGDGTGLREKIEALTESIRRYDRALARAIDAAPDAVRRDCTDGQPLWLLDQRHGAAVESIMEIHRQRDRVIDMRAWYRSELPGHDGLYHGIRDYLAFHREIREARAAA